MKIIVCGGRDYEDRNYVFRELDKIHERIPITSVVEGGADGADALAREWAAARGIKNVTYEADWKRHGKAAGPIRNAEMLYFPPAFVFAFPGGRGTRNLIDQAEKKGVMVKQFPGEGERVRFRLRADW